MKNRIVKILLGIAIAVVLCGVGIYKFHPHNYKLLETKEHTCTEQGIEKYKCWCGSEKTEMFDAIGHDYQTETIDATCIDDGKTIYTCANCGDTYEEVINAKGHDYKEEVTKEPTCTEEGIDTFTCNNCDDTYTEPIEPLGHSYVDGICERCGELSEEKKKDEEAKKKAEEQKKKQEEAKKNSDNGNANKGGGSGSNPSNSDNSGNQGTPSNDVSQGQAAWGFGSGGGGYDASTPVTCGIGGE
ncbi:hypothetical protein [Butyrivibrio sp. AE3006]|uniref:hypothetical protein n=1 Tax=Butyrivibrio sp. AE3006 TaxID=1280673 RepID=UPI0004126E6C|nr:hypothetical protein [Butyrivibrio sp. AE3006]